MPRGDTVHTLRAKPPSRKRWQGYLLPNEDRVYTAEETVFMLSIEKFKRDNHCPHPNFAQVLAIAKALGYRKEVVTY